MYDAVFLTGVCHPNSFNIAQGAYRLAHVLRQAGYSVRVIDGVGSLTALQIKTMVDLVVSKQTKLFCISSTFFSNFSTSVHSDSLVTTDSLPYPYAEWMEIINQVKTNSDAKIAVGGHKTNEFEKNKHLHSYVDHYVYGYADNIIVSLLTDVSPAILKNNTNTIDSNEYYEYETRYDLGDSFLKGEAFTIEMQRGCMFKCGFCAYPLNGKKKGTFIKRPKLIVDELMYCYNQFGSTNFILNSDTFNDNNEYLIEFRDELLKTNVKFNFGINARLDLFYNNTDMIRICKEIGVRSVLFGLESSNPFSLKEIGKGLAFEKVVDTLNKCRDIWGDQVRMTGSYIIGLPYDTEENIQMVADFFSSPDCPLHSIEFDPLYVQNKLLDKNVWQSKYTDNPSLYGFTFEEGSLTNWSNKLCAYGNFQSCVKRAEELLASLPASKKGTIKSAAYMHLPNNLHLDLPAAEKFEIIFKHNTYRELNEFQKSLGYSTNKARDYTAQQYYNLFMINNSKVGLI